MKLKEVVGCFEQAVPTGWALPDDPVGLQIGDPVQEVTRIFAALELTTPLLKKAAQKKCELILLHHPLIFRPLKSLVERDPVQRLARGIIQNNMAMYAMHTNIDLHPNGMAQVWAKKLGCVKAECIAAKPQVGNLKIVTFVPAKYTHSVRDALSNAGAGRIGEYDQCSYTSQGMGSFRGSDRSNPFAGKTGKFEQEAEERLEMVLPQNRLQVVVKALWKAHPYEEPAYDVYSLQDVRGLQQAVWVCEFEKRLGWNEFETRIHKSVKPKCILTGVRPDPKRKVKKIAISTGSGSSFLPIISRLNVDAYLTGEMGHHILWEAKELGINVTLVGHDVSESMFAETASSILKPYVKGVQWVLE